MLVGVGYFGAEPLLPLIDAGRQMTPRRSKVSLWNWHHHGQLNQSGQHVWLRVCKLPSGYHTSLEEITRHIRAVGSLTMQAQVIGGSLHGMTVELTDTDDLVTAEDFADQLEGRVVPLDEVYEPARWIDKFGKPRTFLVFHADRQRCLDEALKMLEGE
jgi:hypothetical protein